MLIDTTYIRTLIADIKDCCCGDELTYEELSNESLYVLSEAADEIDRLRSILKAEPKAEDQA
jgi:hypothetical protein